MKRIKIKKEYTAPVVSVLYLEAETMMIVGSTPFTNEGPISTPTGGQTSINNTYRLDELSTKMGKSLNSRSTLGYDDSDISDLLE